MRLFEFVPEETSECVVRAFLHTVGDSSELKQRKHPAVIICPGGGYEMLSDREAEPVAEPYFAAGYNVFILKYSVGENAKDFLPLFQLANTIDQIRRNCEEWVTDKERIAVCGFSAGGHLACSLGTLFNDSRFKKAYGRDVDIRPNAMILCYPVITADNYAHVGSIERVSGAKAGTKEYNWFGLDKHVDAQTPPAFLWHTSEDKLVPVENSLKMAAAMSSVNVPFELHVFPHGEHGMSVCTKQVNSECEYNSRWLELSIKWLNSLFGFRK